MQLHDVRHCQINQISVRPSFVESDQKKMHSHNLERPLVNLFIVFLILEFGAKGPESPKRSCNMLNIT